MINIQKLKDKLRPTKNKIIAILFPWRKITDWRDYRLADMVKSLNERGKSNGKKLHLEKYPLSIASQYMRKTDKINDIDLLIKLVDKYNKKIIPNTDELVVHLRVGEVIEKSSFSVEEFLAKQQVYVNPAGARAYVRPLSFYQDVISHANDKFNSVTLVAGGCHVKSYEKSSVYIEAIRQLFESEGFSVSVRMGYAPDDDFVYMCRAKYFVPSGGGFSRFIKGIVDRKGGQIIDPSETES